jgi:hypothetical protein
MCLQFSFNATVVKPYLCEFPLIMLSFQGEKGAKGDPGPMGLPVSLMVSTIILQYKNMETLSVTH